MQKAIIDIGTRVIKRLTTDEQPEIEENEAVVELEEAIDLSGGFWKLDEKNKKVEATEVDADLARVDPKKIEIEKESLRKAYKDAIGVVLKEDTLPESLKQYFSVLNKLVL